MTAEAKDYEMVMAQLLFGPGQHKQCVYITILDDNILEKNETFQISLSTSVAGVTLCHSANITIIDKDDGESIYAVV